MHLVLVLYLLACHRAERDESTAANTGIDDPPPSGEGDDTDSSDPEDVEPGVAPGTPVDLPSGHTVPAKAPLDPEDAELAALAELSEGDCPDLTVSGTSTFHSAGLERTVTVIYPTVRASGAAVAFFFHGMDAPPTGASPGAYMASSWMLDTMAAGSSAIIVIPEAPDRTLSGQSVYLWDVEDLTGADLVLYDDLRTCLSRELEVDLHRFFAVGFDGGGWMVTELLKHRADTLAGAVEISGGANVTVGDYGEVLAPYDTPAWKVPTLLISGGEEDVWPEEDPLVDFERTTDELAGALGEDGVPYVRCRHDLGHELDWDSFVLTESWILAHGFGEESPFVTEGLGDDAGWCALGGS